MEESITTVRKKLRYVLLLQQRYYFHFFVHSSDN